MIKKKHFFILKNLFITLCAVFLCYEIYINFNTIENIFIKNYIGLVLVVLLKILHLNIISLRNFVIFVICGKYKGKFIDWSQIFFESLILNTLVSHTGSVYRAIETKKRGLDYKKYAGLFYILFISYISINILLVFIELTFIKEVSFQFKINLLLIFLSLFLMAIYTPKLVDLISHHNSYFKRIYKFKVIKKFFEAYHIVFIFLKNQTFLKKTILYLLGYGITIHLIELYIFYVSSNIILDNLELKTLIILFGINFILDRVPFISNIPGINEIIFASISIPLGLYFHQGLLLKLLLRITGIISIMINYISFYFLNKLNKIKL
jgi:hypothetical protein